MNKLVCAIVSLFISGLYAQAPEFKFEHISEKQNLSHNTVIDILQDKEGFLWFTTIDGLNKFDGYTCRVYKHVEGDSTSISANFLHGLYEDSKGNLWINTRDGGVNRLNKKTGKFKHYKHDPENPNSLTNDKTSGVLEDVSGKFWITTETGLNLLDPETGFCEHFRNNSRDINSPSSSWLNMIIRDREGYLWLSSVDGLNKFDPVKRKFTRYYKEPNNINSLSENYTTYLYEDNDGILWIGTKGGGLNSYDKKRNIFNRYNEYMLRYLHSVPLNINSIISYDNENLLIGTEGEGLLLFNKVKNIFYSYKNEPKNTSSISNNIVTKVYRDNQNIFWIGTWGGGVNKLGNIKKNFKLYNTFQLGPDKKNKNSLSSNSVFAILKEKNNIWLGTAGSTLLKLNRTTGSIRYYSFTKPDKQAFSNEAKLNFGTGALYSDNNNQLWVGHNGLVKLNKETGSYKTFSFDPFDKNSIGSNDIKYITGDKSGNLWIGTNGGGACMFNPKTNKWTRYFYNDKLIIQFIHEDKDGYFWLGTYKKGLIKLDIHTGKIITYRHNDADPYSISHDDVRQIIETKNDELWFATYGGGISRFDIKSGKFYSITEKEGLSNNFTYGILEDEKENFWISTNYGITRYSRKINSFKIYTEEDGLQNNEFNTGAYFKADDGEMFFGGINGFNSFYPADVFDNQYVPPVYLTSFKIFDKEIMKDTLIEYKKNIVLSWADKFFSFDFTALNFTNPSENQYAYKLDGFDNGWIRPDNRRFASYTNLDPGEYTFRVIASNNDGVWNKKGVSLNIIVTPPFWRTWWFLVLCSITALIIVIVTVRYYSTRKLKGQIRQLEKEQAIRKERERISRDLHDNVGSQLTFLISSIDNLTFTRDNPKLFDRLKDVSSYGRKTIKELRNTIWAMKHENTDIKELILKLNEFKQEINSSINNIYLDIIDSITSPVLLSASHILNLYRIIQEAVQNIIKHSGASRIEVCFSEIDDKIMLRVKDNGKGFDIDNIIKGNGLNNMKNRCEESGGEFQIFSSGEGTIINCTLKK